MIKKIAMSSNIEPSWCRTTNGDTAEATFTWTIDNFKDRPEKVKESVKSAIFTVKGPGKMKTKWRIEIYPKGKEDDENYVSFYLYLKEDSSSKVNAKYNLHIIDGARKERETKNCFPKVFDFNGKNSGWGWKNWMKQDKFNDHPDLLSGGSLTLKCELTVFGTEKVLSGSDNDSENPDPTVHLLACCQNQLGKQLGNLFTDKQLSDVKIECEGQTFDCHQAILAARSPVFMAMFQSNMKEKETKRATIDDFKAEVVSEMLNFIYTGTVSDKDIGEIASELLAAADKYQLELLKKLCEERLCSTLKVTNCVEYVVLGDMYQTFKLRSKALKLAAENVDSIIDTDVFKDLFKQMPELAWEVMKAQNKK